MNDQEMIDDIMDNFDFEKVHRVMVFMGWDWKENGVPSLPDIKREARRLLRRLHGDVTLVSCGGFTAGRAHGELVLSFVLESWGDV